MDLFLINGRSQTPSGLRPSSSAASLTASTARAQTGSSTARTDRSTRSARSSASVSGVGSGASKEPYVPHRFVSSAALRESASQNSLLRRAAIQPLPDGTSYFRNGVKPFASTSANPYQLASHFNTSQTLGAAIGTATPTAATARPNTSPALHASGSGGQTLTPSLSMTALTFQRTHLSPAEAREYMVTQPADGETETETETDPFPPPPPGAHTASGDDDSAPASPSAAAASTSTSSPAPAPAPAKRSLSPGTTQFLRSQLSSPATSVTSRSVSQRTGGAGGGGGTDSDGGGGDANSDADIDPYDHSNDRPPTFDEVLTITGGGGAIGSATTTQMRRSASRTPARRRAEVHAIHAAGSHLLSTRPDDHPPSGGAATATTGTPASGKKKSHRAKKKKKAADNASIDPRDFTENGVDLHQLEINYLEYVRVRQQKELLDEIAARDAASRAANARHHTHLIETHHIKQQLNDVSTANAEKLLRRALVVDVRRALAAQQNERDLIARSRADERAARNQIRDALRRYANADRLQRTEQVESAELALLHATAAFSQAVSNRLTAQALPSYASSVKFSTVTKELEERERREAKRAVVGTVQTIENYGNQKLIARPKINECQNRKIIETLKLRQPIMRRPTTSPLPGSSAAAAAAVLFAPGLAQSGGGKAPQWDDFDSDVNTSALNDPIASLAVLSSMGGAELWTAKLTEKGGHAKPIIKQIAANLSHTQKLNVHAALTTTATGSLKPADAAAAAAMAAAANASAKQAIAIAGGAPAHGATALTRTASRANTRPTSASGARPVTAPATSAGGAKHATEHASSPPAPPASSSGGIAISLPPPSLDIPITPTSSREPVAVTVAPPASTSTAAGGSHLSLPAGLPLPFESPLVSPASRELLNQQLLTPMARPAASSTGAGGTHSNLLDLNFQPKKGWRPIEKPAAAEPNVTTHATDSPAAAPATAAAPSPAPHAPALTIPLPAVAEGVMETTARSTSSIPTPSNHATTAAATGAAAGSTSHRSSSPTTPQNGGVRSRSRSPSVTRKGDSPPPPTTPNGTALVYSPTTTATTASLSHIVRQRASEQRSQQRELDSRPELLKWSATGSGDVFDPAVTVAAVNAARVAASGTGLASARLTGAGVGADGFSNVESIEEDWTPRTRKRRAEQKARSWADHFTFIVSWWLRSRGKLPKRKIDDSEKVRYRLMFDLLDSDKSGEVEFGELLAALSHIGLTLTAAELRQLTSVIDSNASGGISFQEFVNGFASIDEWGPLFALRMKRRLADAKNKTLLPFVYWVPAYHRRRTLEQIMDMRRFHREPALLQQSITEHAERQRAAQAETEALLTIGVTDTSAGVTDSNAGKTMKEALAAVAAAAPSGSGIPSGLADRYADRYGNAPLTELWKRTRDKVKRRNVALAEAAAAEATTQAMAEDANRKGLTSSRGNRPRTPGAGAAGAVDPRTGMDAATSIDFQQRMSKMMAHAILREEAEEKSLELRMSGALGQRVAIEARKQLVEAAQKEQFEHEQSRLTASGVHLGAMADGAMTVFLETPTTPQSKTGAAAAAAAAGAGIGTGTAASDSTPNDERKDGTSGGESDEAAKMDNLLTAPAPAPLPAVALPPLIKIHPSWGVRAKAVVRSPTASTADGGAAAAPTDVATPAKVGTGALLAAAIAGGGAAATSTVPAWASSVGVAAKLVPPSPNANAAMKGVVTAIASTSNSPAPLTLRVPGTGGLSGAAPVVFYPSAMTISAWSAQPRTALQSAAPATPGSPSLSRAGSSSSNRSRPTSPSGSRSQPRPASPGVKRPPSPGPQALRRSPSAASPVIQRRASASPGAFRSPSKS